MHRFAAIGACAIFVAVAMPADAGTITLSDRATVASALGAGAVVEDFTSFTQFDSGTFAYCAISSGSLNAATNLTSVPGSCTGVKPGTVLPGATYSVPLAQGSSFKISADFNNYTGGFLQDLTANTALTITFDAAQVSFGFDTNNIMGNGFGITINFTDGTAYTASPTGLTSKLTGFGFTSSVPDIANVVITPSSGHDFAVDNFTYGPGVAAVPEPASLALLAGFLGLGALARRRAA